jgi:hypothetical protein
MKYGGNNVNRTLSPAHQKPLRNITAHPVTQFRLLHAADHSLQLNTGYFVFGGAMNCCGASSQIMSTAQAAVGWSVRPLHCSQNSRLLLLLPFYHTVDLDFV